MNGDTTELIKRMKEQKVPKYMHYFGIHLYRFNYKQVDHLKKILRIVTEMWEERGDKNYVS